MVSTGGSSEKAGYEALLWSEGPKQARVFLDELSSVYRYRLRTNRNSNLPGQPLHIDSLTDDNGPLQVRNTVQRKTGRVASNGVGLTDILTKCQMLNQQPPIIRGTDGEFVVILPLIAS